MEKCFPFCHAPGMTEHLPAKAIERQFHGAPSQILVDQDELKRADQLDVIAAVLPHQQRDLLAANLTDDDVATLRHLVDKGIGANTLRAMASDLAYLDAWCRAATGASLPWPAPQPLLLKFIAHHLWDAAERNANQEHGMPADVAAALKGQGLLRRTGPHAPATVRRRMALWSTLHRWRGLIGPFADPHVKLALKVVTRGTHRTPKRKSQKALTRDVLDKLLATCGTTRAADIRDRAVLLFGFASGGRRRSEIASLRVEQIEKRAPVPPKDAEVGGPTSSCIAIHLGRTKTEHGDQTSSVLLVGPPADALQAWLKHARIASGPVFRAIDRWGKVGERAVTPEAINLIIKTRCRLAGLDAQHYSAHGLRSGYLTEAGRRGIPILEAMQQSRHKTVQQASAYYNEANLAQSQAARLME